MLGNHGERAAGPGTAALARHLCHVGYLVLLEPFKPRFSPMQRVGYFAKEFLKQSHHRQLEDSDLAEATMQKMNYGEMDMWSPSQP